MWDCLFFFFVRTLTYRKMCVLFQFLTLPFDFRVLVCVVAVLLNLLNIWGVGAIEIYPYLRMRIIGGNLAAVCFFWDV